MIDITSIINEKKKELKLGNSEFKEDKKCPFTGDLSLRGKTFTGVIVSKDTHRTAKVEWTQKQFIKKYERFMVRRTKVAAHNPEVISAQVGDMVIIAECKPISKTKKFVVIKNLGHSKDYMIKKESIEEDKKVADQKSTSERTSQGIKERTDERKNTESELSQDSDLSDSSESVQEDTGQDDSVLQEKQDIEEENIEKEDNK
jgi:small subunit ribosomal protein S17